MKRKINLDTIDLAKLRRYKEDTLRKQVIIPLLSDLGADYIEDMHKNKKSEQGIDVYFETFDIFGHRRRFGIQIKREDLVCQGRPDKNKNIETICTQTRLAFGKEITLSTSEPGKVSVYIDGYYIITAGEVNETSTSYIYQQRKSSPYIHVIDGKLLLKIISQRRRIRKNKEFISTVAPLSLPLKTSNYRKKR